MLRAALRLHPTRTRAMATFASFTPAPVRALCDPLLQVSVVSKRDALPAGAVGGAPVIATHSGSFHVDEALGCGLLHLLPAYASSPVVRTRVPAEIDAADVVVDVGATYEPARMRYDHHQASFTTKYRDGECTKLSSAGLVFKHHGADVVRAVAAAVAPGAPLDEPTLAKLAGRVYDRFILEIDAIDNGVEAAGGALRYRVGTDLSSRVGHLQPAWNEAVTDDALNARFVAAMHLATTEFVAYVHRAVTSWLPARRVIADARAGARGVHPSGQILRLSQFAPWKDHLFELEEEDAAGGEAKRARVEGEPSPAAALPPALYVLYEDSSGSWRVQAVPQEPDSFASRKALPAPWRGLRDAELSAAAGIADGIFVHASGFIGGARSFEGALALASKALDM